MATSLRQQIEDAAIDLLRPLLVEGKGGGKSGYLESVQPYSGDFDRPDSTEVEVAKLLSEGTPCVGVSTGSGSYDRVTMGDYPTADETFTLDLLLISGALRSTEERHRGAIIDPGMYVMYEQIRSRIWCGDLGDSVALCRPTATTRLPGDSSEVYSAWHLVFEVTTHVEPLDPDATAIEFDTIHNEINNADDDTVDPVFGFDNSLE